MQKIIAGLFKNLIFYTNLFDWACVMEGKNMLNKFFSL